jgi:hypothetical protein
MKTGFESLLGERILQDTILRIGEGNIRATEMSTGNV